MPVESRLNSSRFVDWNMLKVEGRKERGKEKKRKEKCYRYTLSNRFNELSENPWNASATRLCPSTLYRFIGGN